MGSQSKKKKGTGDVRETTSDIKRQQDADALRTAIQPTFEGTAYTVPVIGTTDWVRVREITGTGQTNAPTYLEQLDLRLDGDFVDFSVNSRTTFYNNYRGFVSPGAFGTAAWEGNAGIGGGSIDSLGWTSDSTLTMNTSVGFSVSLWTYPTNLSALALKRVLIGKLDDTNNKWNLVVDSSGIIYFFVKKAATDYKRQKTGLVTGSWQHIVATFNGATNTPEIYLNTVTGATTVAATQYNASANTSMFAGVQADAPGTSYYEGYYDEIKYYQIVLTPTQVSNLMNTNAP